MRVDDDRDAEHRRAESVRDQRRARERQKEELTRDARALTFSQRVAVPHREPAHPVRVLAAPHREGVAEPHRDDDPAEKPAAADAAVEACVRKELAVEQRGADAEDTPATASGVQEQSWSALAPGLRECSESQVPERCDLERACARVHALLRRQRTTRGGLVFELDLPDGRSRVQIDLSGRNRILLRHRPQAGQGQDAGIAELVRRLRASAIEVTEVTGGPS